MKYRISVILLFSTLLSLTSFSQSKKELEDELKIFWLKAKGLKYN